MMETNDKLLKQFFSEQKMEIEDDGFSRRVIRNLPGRKHYYWSQWWAVLCTMVAIALFFALGGLQGIIGTLREVFVTMVQHGVMNIDPRSIIIAAVVLIVLGLRKAWSMV